MNLPRIQVSIKRRSSHCLVDAPNWDMIRADYERTWVLVLEVVK